MDYIYLFFGMWILPIVTQLVGFWLVLGKLDAVYDLLKQEKEQMSMDFTQINRDVTAQTDVIQSAITLLNGISKQIADAVAQAEAGDTTALKNLQSGIESNTAGLAAAVAANTSAVPVTTAPTTMSTPPAA